MTAQVGYIDVIAFEVAIYNPKLISVAMRLRTRKLANHGPRRIEVIRSMPNDQVERRGCAATLNEGSISRSSTPSLAQRR
jgi:pyrroline-5-carboxylate reductase